MYAETGLMFPYFQNFNQEVHQQFDEFSCSQKLNAQLDMHNGLVHTPPMPDYNFWDEGDLFKAPLPIIEEQEIMNLDPISAAISMISCENDVPVESGQLFSDVYYECKKDLMAKEGNDETPLSEALSIIETPPPIIKTDHENNSDEKLIVGGPFPKSASSTCVSSMDQMHEVQAFVPRPSFLDFPVVDIGSSYGIRRAFSEGDIKTLAGNSNICIVQSPTIRPQITSEDRKEKLSRYRNKKAKRNFGRKIKYACRKALADSQPRIRGRFAKNEET